MHQDETITGIDTMHVVLTYRNYDYGWNLPEDKGGSLFSEPETQAIRDFVLEHDFVYAVSFHSGVDLILYPWSHTEAPPPDNAKFVEISQGLSRVTGGTLYLQCSELYIAYGTWDDWMYGVAGVFALTCEIYGDTTVGAPQTAYSRYPYSEMIDDPRTGYLSNSRSQIIYNPHTGMIEDVIRRWLPVFFYITNTAIAEAYEAVD